MSERKRHKQLKPVEKFEMRQFREAGMSIKDCSTYFEVSVATAMRALAEMREKFGMETLPLRRRQFARNPVAMSQRASENSKST